MTTLIVAGAQHIGGALIQTAGSAALSFANNAINRVFDNRVFEGPRLESFHVQTSRDGRPCRVFMAGCVWPDKSFGPHV